MFDRGQVCRMKKVEPQVEAVGVVGRFLFLGGEV
jgi:hypothetical protein